jgi:hypothetical protein
LPEAEVLLQEEQFDLVIVSASLTELERSPILWAAGKTPVYVLRGFTLAHELIAQVEALLSAAP